MHSIVRVPTEFDGIQHVNMIFQYQHEPIWASYSAIPKSLCISDHYKGILCM